MYCRAQVQIRQFACICNHIRIFYMHDIYIFEKKFCFVTSFLLFYIFYLFIYYFFIDLHLLPAVDSDVEFKIYFRTRNYYRKKLGLLCRMYLSFSETGKNILYKMIQNRKRYKMKNIIILYF